MGRAVLSPAPSDAGREASPARFVWPAAAALLAAAVYAGTLDHGFALDDVSLVRDNADVLAPRSIAGLLVEPYWPRERGGVEAGLHRPLAIVSLALDAALGGGRPAWFHATNVLLHAAVSALVWFLLRGIGTHWGTAFAGAVLFAVHPLHVEAVAPISGRAELLAALFVLLAWLAHRRARLPDAGRGWAVAAGAAWLAALLSKEHALVAPAVFWLDDRMAGRRHVASFLAYGAALVPALLLRVAALGGLGQAGDVVFLDNAAAFAPAPVRLATGTWVQALYAWRFVWPARLSSDWSWRAIPLVDSPADWRLAAGVAFLVALAALVVLGWRRRSAPLALSAAAWGVFFLPASNLIVPVGTIMAERLAYLPSLGACLLTGHAVAALARRGHVGRAIAVTALGLAVAGAAARTVARVPAWSDNATLALTDVLVVPESAKLQAGAGIVLHERGDGVAAERAYRRAIEIWPEYAQVHFNLGRLLADAGRPAEAIPHLARAAELAPSNPRPAASLRELAFDLDRAGRRQALDAYAAAARALPGDLELRFNHARALLAAGRPDEARAVFEDVAREGGDALPAQIAHGFALELGGRPDEAAAHYGRLLDRPGLPEGLRAGIAARLSALTSAPDPAR